MYNENIERTYNLRPLTALGRQYFKQLIEALKNNKKVYEHKMMNVLAVESEIENTGRTTTADLLSLRQLYFATNNGVPFPAAKGALFDDA